MPCVDHQAHSYGRGQNQGGTGGQGVLARAVGGGCEQAQFAGACGLDGGVFAVDGADVLGWWLPGTPAIPASGMFVQVMEYFQPVFFSWSVRFLMCRRDGFTRRAIQRRPPGQFPARPIRPVISATPGRGAGAWRNSWRG